MEAISAKFPNRIINVTGTNTKLLCLLATSKTVNSLYFEFSYLDFLFEDPLLGSEDCPACSAASCMSVLLAHLGFQQLFYLTEQTEISYVKYITRQ